MTRFTVVWHEQARDELARLWIEASDRRAIRSAAAAIDRDLAVDASHRGSAIPTACANSWFRPYKSCLP